MRSVSSGGIVNTLKKAQFAFSGRRPPEMRPQIDPSRTEHGNIFVRAKKDGADTKKDIVSVDFFVIMV